MRLTGFQDRIAFVTGAAGGIGGAVVRGLLEAGARVVATDQEAQGLEALSIACSAGERLRTRALDVRDAMAVEAVVEDIENDWGPIELGVNVAGVLSGDRVVDTSDATWREVFAVNADGVFHVSRALARRWTQRGRGALVTVGSNAAGVPRQQMAAYAASKAAATMFTRCLGLELAPLGIRCNIVAPGSTLTPMQTGMWNEDGGGEARVIEGIPAQYKAGIPLRKLATPEDIANAVLFLLSDQAGHVAMADLYVDGGATLRG